MLWERVYTRILLGMDGESRASEVVCRFEESYQRYRVITLDSFNTLLGEGVISRFGSFDL